ncbi:MAG: hypothetical protein WKF75_17590 [Singulisphaera sp.]
MEPGHELILAGVVALEDDPGRSRRDVGRRRIGHGEVDPTHRKLLKLPSAGQPICRVTRRRGQMHPVDGLEVGDELDDVPGVVRVDRRAQAASFTR